MTTNEDPLEILKSIFPTHDARQLRRYLQASNGSIEHAASLATEHTSHKRRSLDSSKPKKRQRTASGLDAWLNGGVDASRRGSAGLQVGPSVVPDQQPTPQQPSFKLNKEDKPFTKSAFDVLQDTSKKRKTEGSATDDTTAAAAAVNLPVLRLTTPAMIEQYTKGLITLIPNVLPPDLSTKLFLRMIEESRGSARDGKPGWERNRWYMVDRQVESPHTTAFYVAVPRETSYDQKAYAEAATHWYNGENRSSRPFVEEMDEAREVIGALVRTILAGRQKHPLEWQGDWVPNVSAANCYRGRDEGVGWHSDVLTYLGPYPTIASLSLGVARPFRLRPFLPSKTMTRDGQEVLANRTLEIMLPHNSLCIMHAGCQELYKHSIPPVSAMDVFKLSGQKYRERINMTFRHYRPDFAPLVSTLRGIGPPPPGYAGTPLCHCGVPTTLRPDGKGRAKANLNARQRSLPSESRSTQSENGGEHRNEDGGGDDELLFFWTCANGQQNEGKTCGYWKLLDMRKEGRGQWFGRANV